MHADSGTPIASGGIRLALDASQFLRLASEAGRHAPRYSVMGVSTRAAGQARWLREREDVRLGDPASQTTSFATRPAGKIADALLTFSGKFTPSYETFLDSFIFPCCCC